MISSARLTELTSFARAERSLPMEVAADCARLVVPSGNADLPVHRWFRYKESFSARLLRRTLESLIPNPGRRIKLLDPFCGVGTALVAAQEMSASGYSIEAIGIECNPFSAFVARTKTRWPRIDSDHLLELGARVFDESNDFSPSLPSLSSISTERCISAHLSRRILSIRDAIRNNGRSTVHDALLLGLAGIIETVSRVRRDGRALRLVEKPRSTLQYHLFRQWKMIAEDASSLQASLLDVPAARVILGDGRLPTANGIQRESVDVVLSSPPYPNNIDYSEVYKLELWMLGFLCTEKEFLALRRRTFRSHPTCSWAQLTQEFENVRRTALRLILPPILRKLGQMPGNSREKVLLGYCFDLWVSLAEQFSCLKKGGRAVLIVGNSLHGARTDPYLIPTDLILGLLARSVGFEVERILIARAPQRRLTGNHFLRESIVVLRKAA